MPETAKQTAERFKVLACESRVSIVRQLQAGPRKVGELAGALSMSQPAVSQHLKLLKAAGLVADEKDGYWVSYSLNPLRLLEIRQALEGVCRCSDAACADTLRAYREELSRELAWIDGQLAALEARPAARATGKETP